LLNQKIILLTAECIIYRLMDAKKRFKIGYSGLTAIVQLDPQNP